MNPLLSILIWLILTPLGLLVSMLPRSIELSLGPKLGMCWYFFSKKRKKIAAENLRRCFPELKSSPQKMESLLRENFKHYGLLILEILHLFSPLPGHYRRYAAKNSKIEGFNHWKKAHDKGKGVLFVSSHLGNWELMVARGALEGIPLTMVTKSLKPRWLHRKIEASRLSVGVRGAYEPRPLPVILKALRAGESVGFVMDQYAGPPIGIQVEFFGVKVGTLAAVGTLANRTGASVVPVLTYREPKTGKLVVSIEPEMQLDAELDPEKTTQKMAKRVEDWVRQYPTQWLWTHRRFKNVVWPEHLA